MKTTHTHTRQTKLIATMYFVFAYQVIVVSQIHIQNYTQIKRAWRGLAIQSLFDGFL